MSKMYFFEGSSVLENKLNIKDSYALSKAEAEITFLEIYKLSMYPLKGDYDFAHLCKMHKQIFDKIYDWAGKPRMVNIMKPEDILEGRSIEYSQHKDIEKNATFILDKMKSLPWNSLDLNKQISGIASHFAELWKVHPFREGNTRSVTHFMCQFMEEKGIILDRAHFVDNSKHLRTALIAASAYYKSGFDYRNMKQLNNFISDGVIKGVIKKIENKGELAGEKGRLNDYLRLIHERKKSINNLSDSKNDISKKNPDKAR